MLRILCRYTEARYTEGILKTGTTEAAFLRPGQNLDAWGNAGTDTLADVRSLSNEEFSLVLQMRWRAVPG